MNISVYFYDEEGKYTHMDMAPLEFDDNGVQIIPENSTLEYPPDLSTDPRFSVEAGKWIPQVPKEPYSSEDYKADVQALRVELEAIRGELKSLDVTTLASAVQSQGKRISKVDDALIRMNYYLGVAFPSVKHFFTYN
ncbi:hypothetical protein P9Z80_10305 [Bacillus cereus]|nr:hypothetical protein [Bacillus cereus]MEC3256703.1 hypothetical protein [Bacillus cereus]